MKNKIFFFIIFNITFCNISISNTNNTAKILSSGDSIIIDSVLLNESILKAEKYFATLDYNLNKNEVTYMFIDLLNKQFNRFIKVPSINILIKNNDIYKGNHWVLYGKYFANRNEFPSVSRTDIDSILGRKINETDYRSFWCMHCNFFPFTDTIALYNILSTKIKQGEYELTHAALQIQAIVDNKYCNTIKYIIDSLHLKSINAMIDYCNLFFPYPETIQRDLMFENFALLAYMKQYKAISNAYVNYVITNQNTDGGWKEDELQSISNSHTSILAYWFLLEFKDHYALVDK